MEGNEVQDRIGRKQALPVAVVTLLALTLLAGWACFAQRSAYDGPHNPTPASAENRPVGFKQTVLLKNGVEIRNVSVARSGDKVIATYADGKIVVLSASDVESVR